MTTIWVYSIMYNEGVLLPYWLRHYTTFADRIIVYDGESTDGGPDLIRAVGGEVRECTWKMLDETAMQHHFNTQYKEARGQADWIMWVDGDEIMYHPTMRAHLTHLTEIGANGARSIGYSMYADAPPSGNGQIYDECPLGVVETDYSKPQVIKPEVEVVWGVGRDPRASQVGDITFDHATTDPIKLLHYRWLGRDYFESRNAQITKRYINPSYASNIAQVLPDWTGKYSREWYERQRLEALPVI